jgi:hypothetical protein
MISKKLVRTIESCCLRPTDLYKIKFTFNTIFQAKIIYLKYTPTILCVKTLQYEKDDIICVSHDLMYHLNKNLKLEFDDNIIQYIDNNSKFLPLYYQKKILSLHKLN